MDWRVVALCLMCVVTLATAGEGCGGGARGQPSNNEYFAHLEQASDSLYEQGHAPDSKFDAVIAQLEQGQFSKAMVDEIEARNSQDIAYLTAFRDTLKSLQPPGDLLQLHEQLTAATTSLINGYTAVGVDAASANSAQQLVDLLSGEYDRLVNSGGSSFDEACNALQGVADAQELGIDIVTPLECRGTAQPTSLPAL